MGKPSKNMLFVLKNLADGKPANYGKPSGRSWSGGMSGTIISLHRRGLVGRNGEITKAGRDVLASMGGREGL